MKTFKTHIIAGSVALLTTAAAFSAQAATQGAATEPSVMIFNQKLQDAQINVDYAYLPTKGYAVVYGSDKDGNPASEPLGHTALEAGSHVNFKIKLDKAPPQGTRLWVSLYEDKDGKAGFDRQADASLFGKKLPYENHIVVQ